MLGGVAVLLLLAALWVFIDARRNPDRRLRRPSERGTGGYVRRPYHVYDEVDESLPAGVGGPPVEITVRGEDEEPDPPTSGDAEAAPASTGGRRRRRRAVAATAAGGSAVSGQVAVGRSVRADPDVRRAALAIPRTVARPRSIGPRQSR